MDDVHACTAGYTRVFVAAAARRESAAMRRGVACWSNSAFEVPSGTLTHPICPRLLLLAQVLAHFQVDPNRGLSEEDAIKVRQHHGPVAPRLRLITRSALISCSSAVIVFCVDPTFSCGSLRTGMAVSLPRRGLALDGTLPQSLHTTPH